MLKATRDVKATPEGDGRSALDSWDLRIAQYAAKPAGVELAGERQPAAGAPRCYRFTAMKPSSGTQPYPEVAALAARLASLHGLTTVLDVGLAWTNEIGMLNPELRVIGVGRWGKAARRPRGGFPFRGIVDLARTSDASPFARLEPSRTAVLITGPSESLVDLGEGLSALDGILRDAPLTIVATTTPQPLLARLAAAGLQPTFAGRTRATSGDEERTATLVVIDRSLKNVGTAPAEFRVVAIMTAFNEEDIIGPSIGKLVADGIGVYVIDNWSTDRTYEIAAQYEGRGLVGLERFPDAPIDRYEWRSLLGRVESVAASLKADWCIHHDADERRCGPWAGVGLREALWRVDQSGYSAVDHIVLNFQPIDNEFRPGGDFEAHFRSFEFGRSPGLLLQIKAWKNTGPVDLASNGGHEAVFADRRVFPYRFELKHYPIRSQSHGEKKVFRDRIARWDPGERAVGWHDHYDDVRPQQSFLRDGKSLIEDRGIETRAQLLPEMLAGAGLAERTIPSWAQGGWVGRTAHRSMSRIVRSRTYARLRAFPLLRIGVVNRLRRRLRKRLAA
jgi:hypothetical protein